MGIAGTETKKANFQRNNDGIIIMKLHSLVTFLNESA